MAYRDLDLKIAQKSKIEPISHIAKKTGLRNDEIELYGDYKAKVKIDVLNRLKNRKVGKYILVSAMTPTPFGEGKTVTTIGLSMGLSHLGKKAFSSQHVFRWDTPYNSFVAYNSL